MPKHYSLKLFCLTCCQSNGSGFRVYKPYFGLNAILPNRLGILLDQVSIYLSRSVASQSSSWLFLSESGFSLLFGFYFFFTVNKKFKLMILWGRRNFDVWNRVTWKVFIRGFSPRLNWSYSLYPKSIRRKNENKKRRLQILQNIETPIKALKNPIFFTSFSQKNAEDFNKIQIKFPTN